MNFDNDSPLTVPRRGVAFIIFTAFLVLGATSHLQAQDSDSDGISDAHELAGQNALGQFTGYGPTNPNSNDSDGDGTLDGAELTLLAPYAGYVHYSTHEPNYLGDSGNELFDGDFGGLVSPNTPDLDPFLGWVNRGTHALIYLNGSHSVRYVTVFAAQADTTDIKGPLNLITNQAFQIPSFTGIATPVTADLGYNTTANTSYQLQMRPTSSHLLVSEVQLSLHEPTLVEDQQASGDLTLTCTDRIFMRFNQRGTAGVDYAQFDVTGTVSLGTAALTLYGFGDCLLYTSPSPRDA